MRWPLILLLATGLASPASSAETSWTDRQAVLDVVHALDKAIVARDARGLGTLLLPDFIGVVPSGEAFTKNPYIAFHTRPSEGLVAIESVDGIKPAVRVYEGRFALVNRRLAVRRADPTGQVVAYEVQRLEVLRFEQGRWAIASGQGTRVSR
jgi:hypothetical protein